MNYTSGLEELKQCLQQNEPNALAELAVLADRFVRNQRAERLFGSSENTRNEHAQIIYALNELALAHCGISFNDFCVDKQPTPSASTETKGKDGPVEPESVYGVGKRWAVLVGVNNYDDKNNYGHLTVCAKDVQAISDRLVTGGFAPARIRLLTDDTPELPTRDNILVALKAVADATEPGDLLLFYYSGHGDEMDGESYLVARNGRRLALSYTAVPISHIKDIMEKAPARAKIIILDACHSGANIGSKGSKPMSKAFIRRVFEQAEGLAILTSCKQGQLSYEWQAQERSVFTHFLLDALEGAADQDAKGFVTVQDANRHVVNGVKLWASQRNVSQTPTLELRVAGDIILTSYQSSPVPG